MKIFMLTALLGQLICYVCDLLLAYTPNGRFAFSDINDNEKLSGVFDGMSLKRLTASALIGIFSMAMFGIGYVALGIRLYQSSPVYTYIMLPAVAIGFSAGIAHHVFCGAVEWFYVRLGRTEQAREVILDFFKATSPTMYIYYLALLILAVVWFTAVISGAAGLPKWCCVFNLIPAYLIIAPFKLAGAGNLAGAFMFLGMLIFL